MISSAVFVALVARLQIDVQPPAAHAADVRGERRDVRVGREDGHHFLLVRHHRLVADALHGFDLAVQLAGVDARDEACRHDAEQVNGAHQQQRRDHHRRALEADRLPQRPRVAREPGVEHPLDGVVDAAVLDRVRRLEEAAAQHRRQRQRHEAGDQDRGRDRHRELVHQPADDPAHEQDRDEDRRQRQRHRDDREGDLLGAVERRLHPRLAHLHVPDDVLQHDDRVVDDEADRERQRHQREVVEAVAERPHHGERADDRERQRQAGDDRRGQVPQEQEDDHHDEEDGQHAA